MIQKILLIVCIPWICSCDFSATGLEPIIDAAIVPEPVADAGKPVPVEVPKGGDAPKWESRFKHGTNNNDVGINVDVLFVIDNGPSMAEEQPVLKEQFAAFVSRFVQRTGMPPNLHVAAITSDMGTGDSQVFGCTRFGEAGALRVNTRLAGCHALEGGFLRNVYHFGGARETNYPGSLLDGFRCISQLGTHRCSVSQPLEAMRVALQQQVANDSGFVRDDAILAVIFVTDKDDCSTVNSSFLAPSRPSLSTSFLCFEHGIVCDTAVSGRWGAQTNCRPNAESAFLHDVDQYVEFLIGLKPTGQVIVGGLYGDDQAVVITPGASGPTLEASCSGALGQAFPAIRLHGFAQSVSDLTSVSICSADASALVPMANQIIDEASARAAAKFQ